jgi:hypothetical protein
MLCWCHWCDDARTHVQQQELGGVTWDPMGTGPWQAPPHAPPCTIATHPVSRYDQQSAVQQLVALSVLEVQYGAPDLHQLVIVDVLMWSMGWSCTLPPRIAHHPTGFSALTTGHTSWSARRRWLHQHGINATSCMSDLTQYVADLSSGDLCCALHRMLRLSPTTRGTSGQQGRMGKSAGGGLVAVDWSWLQLVRV